MDDPQGALFGAPSQRRVIGIREDWSQPFTAIRTGDQEEYVVSISILRGQLIAVTTRGRIALFDAVTGEERLEQPLEWLDVAAGHLDLNRTVRQSPAFRGTHMVLVAPHRAQFRDLRPFLFGVGSTNVPDAQWVSPDEGMQFVGPPLGVDLKDEVGESLFCLTQGKEDERAGALLDGCLRFFSPEGKEVARSSAPEILLPPAYDRKEGKVYWVSRGGTISVVNSEKISTTGELAVETFSPKSPIDIRPGHRPTFQIAPDWQGRPEAWLATQQSNGQVMLFYSDLSDLARSGTVRWEKRSLGNLGSVQGLAIGIGSQLPDNMATDRLAVSTDQQVRSLSRTSDVPTFPIQGQQAEGLRGSYDPPIVCSAGVIARIQGEVCVDTQNTAWNDEEFVRRAPVPGRYEKAQGIAMFGRRVFIGHGLGVRSYLLTVEEAR